MRIGPITSAIISPIQTKKQAEIESLPKNTSDVKEQQSFSTTTGGDPKINTQDFIALRVGGAKEPSFVELDEAIKRINENIEKVGEALEGFIKKIRETVATKNF